MSKRKLIVGVGIILAIALLQILGTYLPKEPTADDKYRPSVIFTDDSGVRALFLLLEEVPDSRGAFAISQPLDILESPKYKNSTLLVLEPRLPLELVEKQILFDWIDDGGQLILASRGGWQQGEQGTSFFKELDLKLNYISDEPSTLTLTSPGGKLWTKGKASWSESAKPLIYGKENIVAVSQDIKKGRIVFLASAFPFTNAAIGKDDNAVILTDLIQNWGSGRALFDEYHLELGERVSLGSSIKRFALSFWGLPILQALLLLLLGLLIEGRRLGKPLKRPTAAKQSAGYLIKSRADFFRAAARYSLAVSRITENLMKSLPASKANSLKLSELTQINNNAEQNKCSEKDVLRAAELAYQIEEELLNVDRA